MNGDPSLKGSKATKQFNAPYDRLLARRRGRPASNTRGGHNTKLNRPQDEALKDYILMLQASRNGANMNSINSATNRLLFYQTGDPAITCSRRWTKAWMTRHSDFLKPMKERPLSAKRLSSHIVEDVQVYFELFRKCKHKWNVRDEDVSNFGESGFQIGVVSGDTVYVSLDCEAIYNADPNNRELVTVVATINYGGRKVPAMIIFKGAYHIQKHFQNDLDGGTLFPRSPTGYTNSQLGLAYIQHFDRYCPPSRNGVYRVLLFDGHRSYLTNAFLDYYWQDRIRPFKLPPHTTHLLQPLDVAVFLILKHWFQVGLRKETFNSTEEIEKVDFFAMFQTFWDKTFKSRKLAVTSFKKTGLIPPDPLIVLQKMKEYKEVHKKRRTPSPPPRQSSQVLPSSPPPQRKPVQTYS